MGRGYRQTIENGKVVDVISISTEKAKQKYYETRSSELQLFDIQQEDDAKEKIRHE